MKKLKITLILVLIFTLLTSLTASASGPTNYTYLYSFWWDEIATPDAYYVGATLTGGGFTREDGTGLGNFSGAQGMFIRDNFIYVCDTGNNRIVVIEYTEATDSYSLVREFDYVAGASPAALAAPHDIFVDRMCGHCAAAAVPGVPLGECIRNCGQGEVFIADTDNLRVLRLDKDFNFITAVMIDRNNPPPAYESDLDFLPCKLVVDFSGRIFVQARNVNRGFMEFNRNGDFISYMGASRVQISISDIFWRMVATEAQRGRMELMVPTEFNNIALDRDGFVYATLSTFTGNPNAADPVRRLNAVGADILVRNGKRYQGAVATVGPHGDWYHSSLGGFTGWSRFADVVPFDNDSYAVLDRNRSRVFVYDYQGNMLYVFGGPGNKDGYFIDPVAINEMNRDLFILDARTGIITRMRLTEYGNLINQALDYYYAGFYDASAAKWRDVLKLNGNFDLAYIGQGRAALRNDEFYTAMHYYGLKYDQEQYGRAFQLYRKYWIEEHIVQIIIVILVLIAGTKTAGFLLKRRRKLKGGGGE
jgi:hypothetical protein